MNQRAIKALRRALQDDPEYAAAYSRLAEILEAEGFTEKALRIRVRAAALGLGLDAPDETVRSTGQLPQTVSVPARDPGAHQSLEEASSDADSGSPPIPSICARTTSTRPGGAAQAPDRAAAERYTCLGKLLLEKKMADQAVKVFRKALEKDSEYGEAYLGLAEALEATARIEDPEKARAHAVSLGQGQPNPRVHADGLSDGPPPPASEQ